MEGNQRSRTVPQYTLSWVYYFTLTICLALDLLDYLVPFMMTPIYGDFLDLLGLVFGFMYFNVIGLLTILGLIPGLDILPLYSITWVTWYIYHRRMKHGALQDLDKWR